MASDADVLRVMAVDGARADRSLVERLYRLQVLARTFDEKAVSLHRQGRIGTYAPLAGQEATQVGAAAALGDADWLFPTYRDHAMYLARGFALEELLAHLRGRGGVVDGADGGNPRTFPPTIPIATQLPHAVGVGMAAASGARCPDVGATAAVETGAAGDADEWAESDADGGAESDADGEAESDERGERDPQAVLASFGDGATSEGDFHEALNFAGVFDAPVVFCCQNNGYAISTPVERQTASATIAGKARAYGFDGVRVDGDDVLAVRRAVADALRRARAGGGPTLVEAVTYRQGAHTTTDDPSKYRDDAEGADRRDPLDATREHLEAEHGWTDGDETELRSWADERVREAVVAAEAAPDPAPDEVFEHVFASSPPTLRDQRSAARERFGE